MSTKKWNLKDFTAMSADKEPELNLYHFFSESVHKSYKDLAFQVVWEDFSGCRKLWFPPIKGFRGQGELKDFKVIMKNSEIEETYKFIYEHKVCTARLDYPSVFSALYTCEEVFMFSTVNYLFFSLALFISS